MSDTVLKNLVRGILTIVTFAIAVQITTFVSSFLTSLSLGLVLTIVYIFLALYAIGFVFIWDGARQLERLEASN